jgi:hypothetical protein
LKFAYADPPYVGCAKKYPEKTEVDHAVLIGRLTEEYPDGWALSLHVPSLPYILSLCPKDVRVMAWVKPFAIFKPGVGVAYAWEPVIVHGGRRRTRNQKTIRDWVSANVTLKKGLVGAKPAAFAFWLCEIFNGQTGDILDDLYPGTGIVGECWKEFIEERTIGLRDEQEAME